MLHFTQPWRAVRTAEDIEIRFPKVKVVPYASDEHAFEAPAILKWSAKSGVTLEIPNRLGYTPSSAEDQPAGTLLDGDACYWSVQGRTDEGIVLEDNRLSPEQDLDLKKWRAVGETVFVFRPWTITLRHRPNSQWDRRGHCRTGVFRCRAKEIFWDDAKRVVDEAPTFGSTTARGFSEAEGTGYTIQMRSLDDHGVQCHLVAQAHIPLDDLSNYLGMAMALATGAHARWLCYEGKESGQQQLFLAVPPKAGPDFPIHYFAPIDHRTMLKDRPALKRFLVCVIDRCLENPDLYMFLNQMCLCWDAIGTTLQVDALVAASVLEGYLNKLSRFMDLEAISSVAPEEQAALRAALEASPEIANSPLLPRLQGFVQSMGQVRAKDVLHALQGGDRPLFSAEEVKAWGKMRNPLAHGSFWLKTHGEHQNLATRYDHVRNMLNKLVMATVGYSGAYCDYSNAWDIHQFSWPDDGEEPAPAPTTETPATPTADATSSGQGAVLEGGAEEQGEETPQPEDAGA